MAARGIEQLRNGVTPGSAPPSGDSDNATTPLPTWSSSVGPPPAGMTPPPPGATTSDSMASFIPAQVSDGLVVSPNFTPEDALDEQIADLEAWAQAILRRQRLEAVRFWVLRGLAFALSAAAVVLALKGVGLLAVVLVAGAGLALSVEMGWPGAALFSQRRRAVYELRDLQHLVKLRWQKARLSYPEPGSRKRVALAVELLELVYNRREEVGRYLGSSEPNAGIRRSG